MAREVEEFLRNGNVVSGGDILPEADFRDAANNIIDLDDRYAPDVPDSLQALPSVKSEALNAEPALPGEPTELESRQQTWDKEYDKRTDRLVDTRGISYEVAGKIVEAELGPRPEDAEVLEPEAVAHDSDSARNFTQALKEQRLQRELAAVDANPVLRPDEKESEKNLLLARHKASEQKRIDELKKRGFQ